MRSIAARRSAKELDNAGLLGREQLVPEQVEIDERVAYLGFGDSAVLCARRGPSLHDDLE
ncbi:hypothetical protein G6N73_23595 [Mesorhizobium camelthorni]|uniref:Uncharacterized protein n=2 Tax=Allomesorhizobium camelthorni TaxID=475069 RepID=A0A6G4WH24_9HYPH|nr:hypothetical protein [Mesorhizobium camelthorni]